MKQTPDEKRPRIVGFPPRGPATKPYFVTVGNRQKKPLNVRKCRDASNKNGANSPNKKQTVKLVKSVIYLSHEWTRLVLAVTAAALILSS